MRLKLRSRWTALGVGVVTLSLAAPLAIGGENSNDDTKHYVSGLTRPVEVQRDEWGVPHIYAKNNDDLFHAQGFVAAQDRMFQMDTWRRKGLGELSKVLGPDYAEHDKASRLFLYRGSMEKEWASYDSKTKAIATEFAEGVNSYIDWLEDNPDDLPKEFTDLGYTPEKWDPEDVVRIRTHALANNLPSELARTKVACDSGEDATKFLGALKPDHESKVPDGLDPCSIPDDVGDAYNLATGFMTFDEGEEGEKKPKINKSAGDRGGSNSWAVSPERTESGRPLLASDPHRMTVLAPANRYIVHLNAPGVNVIGGGEPWNPGVSLGHNGDIAFGLTNLPIDQTDLYVYDLDPNDPNRYRYDGGWEEFREVEEELPIAGEDNQNLKLQFTRHGPVVKVDEENNRAYGIRTVWSEPGTSPYLGSLSFQEATNFDEFSEAMNDWKTPGSNLTYADKDGNTGWQAGGTVPKRTGKGYDGLYPVPGDGRYEWDGFHSSKDLPSTQNPDEGYFATANEYNIPKNHPVTPSYEWETNYRKDRLDEVLSAQQGGTVQDQVKLQNDVKSKFAEELMPYLKDLSSDDPSTKAALEVLEGYDGVTSADSNQAALFEVWNMMTLYAGWVGTVLPNHAEAEFMYSEPKVEVMLKSFAEPEKWLGEDGAAVRDKLLLGSLKQAYDKLSKDLGEDPAEWKWGDTHFHVFVNPVTGDTIGPVPRGGSNQTVKISLTDFTNFQELGGASFSIALDVGEWDNSQALNAPGQSADPNSPYYDNLHELWAKGGSFPLLYSRDAVDEKTKSTMKLRPRRGRG